MHPLISTLEQRKPTVAVVAGTGQVASSAVAAGADLLLAFNAGLYRSMGIGSLASFMPYGNANAQTLQLLIEQILPRAASVPVIAGVLGADPTMDLQQHLLRLKSLGVVGVTNWPSLGFVDGAFRTAMEDCGFDLASEIRMLQAARSLGLATFGFVHDPTDAQAFASTCDGMILNIGLTRELDEGQDRRDRIQAVILQLNRFFPGASAGQRRPYSLMFGGPITSAEDFQTVLRQTPTCGIAGGSLFERLPVRRAIEGAIRQFKGVHLGERERTAPFRLGALIGRSPQMLSVFDMIRRVGPYDVNVCIEGPTGVGKELVAHELHRLSSRAPTSFVTLNCGAIPDELLESELFGHDKGAFTGAERRRIGKFELSDGGTLFLDEVADLSPKAQVALLRAIQQGEVTRVGGNEPIHVDVRIIAATHQSLQQLVAEGRFRSDLYFRLSQISLDVPPLAKRIEDLPLLLAECIARLKHRLGRDVSGVTAEFERKLMAHDWPGNVRELEHVIMRAAILEDGPQLSGHSFQPGLNNGHASTAHTAVPQHSTELSQRQLAEQAIRQARGNKSRAADLLGISRKTLYSWLRASDAGLP